MQSDPGPSLSPPPAAAPRRICSARPAPPASDLTDHSPSTAAVCLYVHMSIYTFGHRSPCATIRSTPNKKSRAALKRPRPGPRDRSSWTFPILTHRPPKTR